MLLSARKSKKILTTGHRGIVLYVCGGGGGGEGRAAVMGAGEVEGIKTVFTGSKTTEILDFKVNFRGNDKNSPFGVECGVDSTPTHDAKREIVTRCKITSIKTIRPDSITDVGSNIIAYILYMQWVDSNETSVTTSNSQRRHTDIIALECTQFCCLPIGTWRNTDSTFLYRIKL